MKIFVIVPAYNENIRVIELIHNILKLRLNIDIIVVDDGSTDDTWNLLNRSFKKNKKIYLLKHVINKGKGAAMKTGMKMAFKIGGEAVIFIDADGQHDPKYLPKFILGLKKFPIVFGYRILDKNSPWIRRNGNKLAGG